jgi:hypothetical protein
MSQSIELRGAQAGTGPIKSDNVGDVLTYQGNGLWAGEPGGSGAAITPLSRVLYVDKFTTCPEEEQNGAAATSPFATLAQAIAALIALNVGGTLLVVPGDYTAEDPIVWNLGSDPARPLAIRALAPGPLQVLLPDITASGASGADILLEGCFVGTLTTTSNVVRLYNSGFLTIDAALSTVFLTGGPLATLDITCTSILVTDCEFQSNVTIQEGAFRVVDCLFTTDAATITFTGDPASVDADYASYINFLAQGMAVSNGNIQIGIHGSNQPISGTAVVFAMQSEGPEINSSDDQTTLLPIEGNSFTVSEGVANSWSLTAEGCIATYTGLPGQQWLVTLHASCNASNVTNRTSYAAIDHNGDSLGQTADTFFGGGIMTDLAIAGARQLLVAQRVITPSPGDTVQPCFCNDTANDLEFQKLTFSFTPIPFSKNNT